MAAPSGGAPNPKRRRACERRACWPTARDAGVLFRGQPAQQEAPSSSSRPWPSAAARGGSAAAPHGLAERAGGPAALGLLRGGPPAACVPRPGGAPRRRHGHPQPAAPPGPPQAPPAQARPAGGPAAAEGRGAEDPHPQAQEAQLGQPQVRPRPPQHRPGGGLLHPRRGPQPAGAQHRPGGGRPHPGPARRQAEGGARQVRLRPRPEEEVVSPRRGWRLPRWSLEGREAAPWLGFPVDGTPLLPEGALAHFRLSSW